jgi:hypothetical protein
MTILFWVPSVIFSWSCSVSFACFPVVLFGSVLTLGCIALVVLDLLISPEVKYFKRQKEAEEVCVILEKMKRAKPKLGVIINCYHYHNGNNPQRVRSLLSQTTENSLLIVFLMKQTFHPH